MSRIFLFVILIAFSCAQRQSDAEIVTILEMSNTLEKNSKQLIRGNEYTVEKLAVELRSKPEYQPLVMCAEEIKEITLRFTAYLDRLDRQFFRMCQQRPGQDNFDDLSPNLLKNKSLSMRFMNSTVEGTGQTILQNIIDSTLSTQKKIKTQLATVKNSWYLGITKLEFDILNSSAFTFAVDTIQLNGKTRLKNAFEGKSVAGCHAALILLKNEAVNSSRFTIGYLSSKIGSHGSSFGPQVVFAPSKHHFEDGSAFEAEVYLAVSRPYWDVKMKVNGASIPVDDGVGTYKTILSPSGNLTYKVEALVTDRHTKKQEMVSRTFNYK